MENEEVSREDVVKDESKKKKKEKKEKGNKGVETMFRTTMASHLKLSEMADSKANIMISINTIIVSILISVYAKDFENASSLLIPTAILTLVCLLTITISVLSTRPRIKQKKTEADRQQTARKDLLFFGDFMDLSRDEYRKALKEMLQNEEAVYSSMIDNIYAQGAILNRKYRLLKLAYTVFMIGFPLSVLAYAIALMLNR